MRFFKKPLAVLMALFMILGTMVPAISAAGTGVQGDPYTLTDGVSQDITVAAGESAYVQVDASENAVNLTVSGNRMYYDYTVQYGNTAPQSPNVMANVILTLEGGVIDVVINNVGESEITLSLTMEVLELGCELNPAPAVEMNLGDETYYFMNTELEVNDEDGYWWVYTAPSDGVVCINHYTSSENAYQVRVINGTTESLAFDGINSNPVTTFPVSKGDEILVQVYAEPAGRVIPAMSLTISAEIVSGANSSYDAIPVKGDNGFKAYVPAGQSLSYINNKTGAPYSGKGLVITGYYDAIALTTVTVDGVEYNDEDGDGKIELTLPSNENSTLIVAPMITITNGHEWNISYTATVTDSAEEGAYESGTGHKLDFVAEVSAGCHVSGVAKYWYCSTCDLRYASDTATEPCEPGDLVIPGYGYIEHVVSSTPSCHVDGAVEHWRCDDCSSYFYDEALTQPAAKEDVVLPALGGTVTHADELAPGCHSDGNIEHWYCADCGQFWLDEALTQLTSSDNVILPATGSGVVHQDAVEAGCHYLGNIEYWFCPDCEGFWQDEALTQVTNSKNVILPATGSENLVHFDAVAAGCHSNGNIEYWFCADCEQFWQDEALTQLTNSKNVVLPATGSENVVHFDAVAPGCHYDGNIEYWFCPDCEQFWQDEALTQVTNAKNVILPATGSENVIHFEAVAPGCHYDGNIEYWFCPDCEQFWQDETLTQLTNAKNVVLPATGSENLQHIEAVAPACEENGNIEHWYCADCGQFWQDEALTQLTNSKNVILPATGHNYVDGVCSICGEIEVPDHVPADINGDGTVDSKDLTRLMKYLSGQDVVVYGANVNGDNAIDSKDLTRLMKYLAGDDVEVF